MGDVNAEPLPRLLLVEDDARLAPIMTDYLSDEYAVTHVADGTAGLQAALDGSFDVMIVDRRLPGTDGIDLVTSVRCAKIPTPIMVLTALGYGRCDEHSNRASRGSPSGRGTTTRKAAASTRPTEALWCSRRRRTRCSTSWPVSRTAHSPGPRSSVRSSPTSTSPS
ncbi:response regulator transcription factor [Myceligenerans indicum]|uniref:Response regulator transcription factor n=1 Tax=Myceligenerans indicum TaxID=2593663 RepID=A0ABS1LMZ1_9MICO|nr:response regulator [Myceligenerans indicum]MBL0887594.1 response regulator transcription factor [Myceligenerans indicum]